MEKFDLFNWIWTILAVPALWFHNAIKAQSTKNDKAHQRISEHELHVAEKYVRNENFMRLENQIMKKLDSIERKIDAKADK